MYNFTKRARNLLDITAQSEGRRMKSDSIGPEHILLALLSDSESRAMIVLSGLGINFEVLKKNIEQSMRFGSGSSYYGALPVNSRYNRIIDLARNEAKKLQSSFIGSEHLLLALFRDGATRGIDGLSKAGIDYGVVFNEVARPSDESKKKDAVDKKDPKQQGGHIAEFSIDITALAAENKLEPVIGREKEIAHLIRILCRKTKNNPLLIGEAGVGKTAIVDGLAQLIIAGRVPEILKRKKLISLDIASIVAGTKYRGDFEERLKKVMKEALNEKKYIVFIDEIHMIMGAGAAEGSIDAANILKPFLARGEIQCLGATTIREFKKHIEKDPALERRFQSVFVEEPSCEQSMVILSGIKERYEDHHRVRYTDDALHDAVYLSKRYIHDRFLPDKAIDVIDEAGAQARIDAEETPVDIRDIELRIEFLQEKKNEHVSALEFEIAAALRDEIRSLKVELLERQKRWNDRSGEYAITVGKAEISAVISQWTGIPIHDENKSGNIRLLSMETELQQKIIGQDRALSVISRAIRRSRSGIRSGRRPAGIFLFAGPTGVGKTECAKVLAEFLFNDRDTLIRFDMSEYMEKHAVARLIGSPPGYVGYDEGGQLSEKIKRKPYSVILFDEIEKAHPDIFNILLQIFEEGEITDGTGRKTSLRESVIVMTSNAGNSRFDRTAKAGFSGASDDRNVKIMDSLRTFFNPELINRIDEVVVFNPLDKESIERIIQLQLDELCARASGRGLSLSFEKNVKEYISDKSDSINSGARNIRRVIESDIEDRIAEILLSKKDGSPVKICIGVSRNELIVSEYKDMPDENVRMVTV